MKIYCNRNKSDLDILKSIEGKDLWIKVIWVPTKTEYAYTDYIKVLEVHEHCIKHNGRAHYSYGYINFDSFLIFKPIEIVTSEEVEEIASRDSNELSTIYYDEEYEEFFRDEDI